MDAPLLRTKYTLPPVRSNLVLRPQLAARLNAGLECRCLLISAPAGYGKTTLVRSWLSQCICSIAWLSLDESDNDPVRFFRYLISALQATLPGLGAIAGDLPSPATAPALTQALTTLINEITAPGSRDASPLIIVLDDYHTIQEAAIHDSLAYLLDHLPAHAHVVLITRADPPLPLSRLRARNQLLEIRMSDLRFTTAEATTFLNQVMGLHLTAGDVQALEERTEGWVVGLQMAALAIQSMDNAQTVATPRPTGSLPDGQSTASFVRAFAGSDRYILDYLVEEVLEQQPDDLRTFLLYTAILDRLNGPLCDALCREAGPARSGQEVLEWLENANLFITPLDHQREWYRYHHLFADLLRQRLQHSQPALALELHRRAARWYEQNDFLEEAVSHALKGEDPEHAALLIERAAEAILMRSELVTLATWFGDLPQEIVRRHPQLCLYYSAVLLLSGEPLDKIQTYLAAAGYETADEAVHGVTFLRALLALWQGNVAQSVQLCQQALAGLPEQSPFWRSIVSAILGIVYLYNGADMDLAEEMLETAAELGEKTGNVISAVIALCHLAEVRIAQGQLRAAKKLFDRALALAIDNRGRRLPIGDIALAGAAGLLLEWDEPEEAERLLVSILDLSSEGLIVGAMDGYLALARVKQSQGEGRVAQEAIEQVQRIVAHTGATMLVDQVVTAAQARLWIAQGDLDAVAGWARRRGLMDEPAASAPGAGNDRTLYVLDEYEYLTLAELRLAQDKPAEVLHVLAALLDKSRALQRTDTTIKTLVLMAMAHQRLEQPDQALSALAQALELARPGGYVRTFVDRGPRMAQLLYQALAQGIAVDYVQRLLAAFTPGAAPSARHKMLVEPLSERELQVLRLLASALSSAEIANLLYVSANTVRFHLKNIYAKLNVHAREEAVRQAHELGLL